MPNLAVINDPKQTVKCELSQVMTRSTAV